MSITTLTKQYVQIFAVWLNPRLKFVLTLLVLNSIFVFFTSQSSLQYGSSIETDIPVLIEFSRTQALVPIRDISNMLILEGGAILALGGVIAMMWIFDEEKTSDGRSKKDSSNKTGKIKKATKGKAISQQKKGDGIDNVLQKRDTKAGRIIIEIAVLLLAFGILFDMLYQVLV
ncbi:MAG: hypothetical protein ACFFD4_13690 [Candidatus Odinarchaeota archaeon]